MNSFQDILSMQVDDVVKPDEKMRRDAVKDYVPFSHDIKLPATNENDSFVFLSLEDLAALPDPKWLIETLLTEHSFNLLFGAPGSGKSFIALSFAACIAYGIPWLGKKVEQGPVVYAAAEGLLGFKQRFPAFQTHYGLEGNPPLFFADGSFDLTNETQVIRLAYLIATVKPKLVVIDTLARVFGGGDENSAQHMNLFVKGVDTIRKQSNAAVLVVHHTPKNNPTQERGSGALRGAADAVIACIEEGEFADGKVIKLTCEKMKDAEPFEDIPILLKTVELPDGRSSLVPELTAAGRKKHDGGKHSKAAINVLKDFGAKGASHAEWKKLFVERSDNSEATFNRAIKSLQDDPRVRKEGEGRGARYYYVSGESVSVSSQCQDGVKKPPNGVSSPPFLGGDTDTNKNDIQTNPYDGGKS